MARRSKPGETPARSRKSLAPVVAYSRTAGGRGDDSDGQADPADAEKAEPAAAGHAAAEPDAKPEPEPAAAEPDAKPEPAAAKPEPAAAQAEAKPADAKPPTPAPAPTPAPVAAAPTPAPAPPVVADDTLGPIYEPLPRPKEIPVDDPDSAAPPPGIAPRGDSRSFRRHASAVEDFILIYRFQTFVISRTGTVGKRGVWKVVEYPTMGSASHAYAQECSRLVQQGFADFRG